MLFKKEHDASACLKLAKVRSFPLGKIHPEVRSASMQPSTSNKDTEDVTKSLKEIERSRASPTPARAKSPPPPPSEAVAKRPNPKQREGVSRRVESESPLSDIEMEDATKADAGDHNVVSAAGNGHVGAIDSPATKLEEAHTIVDEGPIQSANGQIDMHAESDPVSVKAAAKSDEPLVLEPIKEKPLLNDLEAILPAVDVSLETASVKKGKRKAAAKEDKRQPPKKRAKKNQPIVVQEPIDIEVDTVNAVAQPMDIDVKPVVAERPASIDPIASGLAKDDEDLYLLRLAIEAKAKGKLPMLPEEAARLREEAAVAGEPVDEEEDEEGYVHPAGCARAHGYYKVSEVAKSAYLPQRNRAIVEVDQPAGNSGGNGNNASNNNNAVASSRSARVATRRFVQGMEQSKKAADADSDVFAFNQLRTRKKQLKFQRSPIHDWGLYAVESITAGEMVIEYVGEVIRAQVADIREKWYEKIGIGSSYLFRVDDDAVVDATKKGSMARLINHCCTPNCTAKIITINGEKKVRIGFSASSGFLRLTMSPFRAQRLSSTQRRAFCQATRSPTTIISPSSHLRTRSSACADRLGVEGSSTREAGWVDGAPNGTSGKESSGRREDRGWTSEKVIHITSIITHRKRGTVFSCNSQFTSRLYAFALSVQACPPSFEFLVLCFYTRGSPSERREFADPAFGKPFDRLQSITKVDNNRLICGNFRLI
jgi:hypothetical protein